jgi:hypothetical protein
LWHCSQNCQNLVCHSSVPWKVLINFYFFHLKNFLIKKFSLLLHAECVLCIFLPVSSHLSPCI